MTARRAKLDELEEQPAKQLAEVRAELAVAERVLERMSEQLADERASATPTPEQARLLDAVSNGPPLTTDGLRGEGILPVPPHAAEEPKPLRRSRRTTGPGQGTPDFPS
jgi:hypothetical protein